MNAKIEKYKSVKNNWNTVRKITDMDTDAFIWKPIIHAYAVTNREGNGSWIRIPSVHRNNLLVEGPPNCVVAIASSKDILLFDRHRPVCTETLSPL